jgi:hypothetical protein
MDKIQLDTQTLFTSMIAILIIFQVVSVIFLWSISTVGLTAERLFALFLGADVLSFAMVSYLYRRLKLNESPSFIWLVSGSVMLVILMFSAAVV